MKRLVILLSVFAIFAFPVSVTAAIIPESNLIGDTVEIEPDENFIKENIKNGNPKDTSPEETAEIISLDRDSYVKKFTLPFLYLSLAGLAVYGIDSAVNSCVKKKNNK